MHGMGDWSMHASSPGLFVANWRKWSLTLDFGSCMSPKNTMFPARFWMQVIRAMLSKSAEPDGSHVALGRLNEETIAKAQSIDFKNIKPEDILQHLEDYKKEIEFDDILKYLNGGVAE